MAERVFLCNWECLYKTLVRPHLEYAVPVWAALGGKDLVRLEQLQVQCLRSITGVKAHSSAAAVEVDCGVMPLRIRFCELCSREFFTNSDKGGWTYVEILVG